MLTDSDFGPNLEVNSDYFKNVCFAVNAQKKKLVN